MTLSYLVLVAGVAGLAFLVLAATRGRLRPVHLRDERGQAMSIETVVIIGIAVVLAVGVGAWAVSKMTAAQQQVPDPNPPAVVGG